MKTPKIVLRGGCSHYGIRSAPSRFRRFGSTGEHGPQLWLCSSNFVTDCVNVHGFVVCAIDVLFLCACREHAWLCARILYFTLKWFGKCLIFINRQHKTPAKITTPKSQLHFYAMIGISLHIKHTLLSKINFFSLHF